MPLIPAWKLNFSGTDPLPIASALAAPPYTDRNVFGEYRPWTRYNPYPGVFYGHTPHGLSPPGALWQDTNHSQAEYLWLIGIVTTNPIGSGTAHAPPSALIPTPSRTLGDGEIVSGLDLYGGQLDIEIAANNLFLSQYMQIAILLQWFDPESNAGRGGNVNYLVRLKKSIDEVMGWTPAHARPPSGEQRSTSWTPISISFPADNPDTPSDECADALIAIDGRPDKVSANVYGRSISAREAYRRQLLNMMIVAHSGQSVPTVQPLERASGGYGEFYCRKFELFVDPALNPNAVAIS